jgi:hypothetical protein
MNRVNPLAGHRSISHSEPPSPLSRGARRQASHRSGERRGSITQRRPRAHRCRQVCPCWSGRISVHRPMLLGRAGASRVSGPHQACAAWRYAVLSNPAKYTRYEANPRLAMLPSLRRDPARGHLDRMTQQQLELVAEGMAVYKDRRSDIATSTPSDRWVCRAGRTNGSASACAARPGRICWSGAETARPRRHCRSPPGRSVSCPRASCIRRDNARTSNGNPPRVASASPFSQTPLGPACSSLTSASSRKTQFTGIRHPRARLASRGRLGDVPRLVCGQAVRAEQRGDVCGLRRR